VAATCDQTGPVACPACASRLDPNVQAFCTSGKCQITDVRTDAISKCSTSDDCILRYATCCQPCNGGSPEEVVAVNRAGEGALAIQLCSGSEACDKCLPSFGEGIKAACNASTGHCEVVRK
jgi:hypothetical protein